MERRFKFRRTTILCCALAAFLAGLGLARSGTDLPYGWVLLALVLLACSLRRSRAVLLLAAVLAGCMTGWWRGSQFYSRLEANRTYYDQRVVLTGVAQTDAVYDDRAQLSFDISQVRMEMPHEGAFTGRIGIEGFGAPAIYRGDVVRVEGKLRPSLGSRQGRISFARLSVLGRADSLVEDIRHRFVAGMQSALPEPLASFGLGLLIGQRNTLPDDVSRQLSAVGLTHLIAVSGYNLTILVRGTRRLLYNRSKYQSIIVSLLLIATFLLFTGFSPSIIRAAIVSLLGLWAWADGRAFRPVLLLLLSAALTAGASPLYIWSDIGWYLSFLAFFGVLVLAPLLAGRLYAAGRQPRLLGTLLLESLCAQLMTVPLILYIFSEVSLISLPANILVVPLVPFAMLSALLAGAAGMLLPAFAGWLSLPALIILTYMLDVVQLMARVPHALVNRSIGMGFMLGMYAVIVLICVLLSRKLAAKNGTITDDATIKGGAV